MESGTGISRLKLWLAAEVMAASVSTASLADCPSCVLGIWDGPNIGVAPSYGRITPGMTKDVYVGLCADPAVLGTPVDAIEFSIEGIDREAGVFVVGSEFLTSTAPLPIGTYGAPPGYFGVGGVLLIWYRPITMTGAFLKLSLVTLGPLTNHILHVTQRFPQRYVVGPYPVVYYHGDLGLVIVHGGCYLLNWDGLGNPLCFFQNPACTVGVTSTTWTAVKTLYRD